MGFIGHRVPYSQNIKKASDPRPIDRQSVLDTRFEDMNESSHSPDETLANIPHDAVTIDDAVLQVGSWRFDRAAGTLSDRHQTQRLEPKVASLLALLAGRAGTLVTRDEIAAALWPDVVVSDEAVAKCVSKLRKALGDDPKSPRHVETLPKRGYRLLSAATRPGRVHPPNTGQTAAVEPPAPTAAKSNVPLSPALGRRTAIRFAAAIVVAGLFVGTGWRIQSTRDSELVDTEDSRACLLTKRGHDFYFQIERSSNESAIALYEQAIADDPQYAPAIAGLANALVQRVIRWPDDPRALEPLEYPDLESAIRTGRTSTAQGRMRLDRALGLAERAVRLAPEDAEAHRALGFVQSALEDHDEAMHSYRRAIILNPDAWDAMLNMSDLLKIRGDAVGERRYLEMAYAGMERVYDVQTSRIRPWHADVGVLIGDRYAEAGQPHDAESWYRRVLALAPLHHEATQGLAQVLRHGGDPEAARRLCTELEQRTDLRCGDF